MIQKRYEYIGKSGKVWTSWRNYSEDDSQLDTLQNEEQWQMKGKLKNEYRIV